MDRTLSGDTTPGQSEPWSDGKLKGSLHSPKLQHYRNLAIRSFSVVPGHSIRVSYASAEMQSVYSTVPADWAEMV